MDVKDLKELLDVGQLATIEKTYGGVGEKYTVRLLGWDEGRFLMLELPKVGGSPVIIQPKTLLKCRVASKKGLVLTFESISLDSVITPYQLLFISYPNRFDIILVRSSERVPLLLSAKVKVDGSEQDGYIVDMSEGGIGLEIPEGIKEGSEVRVTFVLPDGEPVDNLLCEVRRSQWQKERGVYNLGLRFKGDGKKLEKIKKFLKDLKTNLSLWRR